MRQIIRPVRVARDIFFAGTLTACAISQLALAQEINIAPPVAPAAQDSDGTSSAACFNPDLFKVGTHYRKHLKSPNNDGVIFEYTIQDNANFNGADGLIAAQGFMNMLKAPGVMGTSNPVVDYFQLEQTAEGPVYYKHGTTMLHENSRIANQLAKESITHYQPPQEFGLFALQPGQNHSFSTSNQSIENGQITKENIVLTKVSYVGRADMTTAAGTFSTCHFVVNDSDHYYIVGMGLPLRLGKTTELQADSHVNGVPLSAWAK